MRVPIKFYLRKQLIGGVKYGKTCVYIYQDFHGSRTGMVRALDARGAQRQVRAKYKEAEFFKPNP